MRILIEEYQYDVAKVKDILHGIDALENVEGKVSIHYVGYYYNTLLKDCVFILPKVLLKDVNGQELVFGKYRSEEIANLNKDNPLSLEERNFIYKFSVWIYRAIVVYKNDKRNDTSIVYHTKLAQIGKGSRRLSNTYLDILLQLIQFNRDNQSFFFFIVKNLHSGFNKINWTRTISTTTAIIQKDRPIYLNPVNKKRQINFDEELLVIFFSILNHIGDTYGFAKEINVQFPLITGKKFETYLKGFGKTRLRQIKYKYFSDKALELWNLCYAFFEEAKAVKINTDRKEYLLVKDFYHVFETIIDELIGDNPLPDGMEKKQEDGKIVDHLFTAKSLIEGEKTPTYYIGDSKYYKIGHPLGEESIYKQYTYARNVIQWNLDIFNSGNTTSSGVKLRDNVTEGYNIIPNFFISAKLDDSFDYANDGIDRTDRKHNKHRKVQFKNRLFDRDTLLLFHYDVNFLYVLSLYARDNSSQKAVWKEKMRKRFRDEIQEWLQTDYDFYAMTARPGVDSKAYFKTHFQEVLGKTYTPFADNEIYSLALWNDSSEKQNNETLLAELRNHFFVERCGLGENPQPIMNAAIVRAGATAVMPMEDLVLVGCLRKYGHRDWVFSKGKYNIRLDMGTGKVEGAVKPSYELMNVSHFLLYDEEAKTINHYFDLGNPNKRMPEMYGFEKMKSLDYPFRMNRFPKDSYERRLENRYGKRAYLVYDINTLPVELPGHAVIDLRHLLDTYVDANHPIGMPFVIAFSDLIGFIR